MDREERIANVLGGWQLARDRGQPADPEAVIEAHPDLAEDLRARFAVVRALDELTIRPRVRPDRIGEYRVLREIARGGMGVVYEAEQTSMRRRVALKVLFPSVTSTPRTVGRFRREAWAAGQLQHTHIVSVHQLGQEGGAWFLAMELVNGRPLSEVIRELAEEHGQARPETLGRAPLGKPRRSTASRLYFGATTGERAFFVRVAEMFAGVASGLDAAHRHRIVHRDIKPSNLILDAGGVLKIMDFGLAHVEEQDASLTTTGDLLGTPLYMSPEQAGCDRSAIDARTDIYSLGATLYELLTLRTPFAGRNVHEITNHIVGRDPRRPGLLNSRIPPDLETIVLKAMEKDPSRRYRSAGALAEDLWLFAKGDVIRARRMGPLGRTWRKVKRRPLVSSLAAALLVLAVFGAIVSIRAARERARRLELEYVQLCDEADRAFLAGDHGGQSALEMYGEAIALDPTRPEAYVRRALCTPRPFAEGFADLAAARERGLSERIFHLARGVLHHRSGSPEQARAEEQRAKAWERSGAGDAFWEAFLLSEKGKRTEALDLLEEAIENSDPRDVTHYLALKRRSRLRERAGDFFGALEDAYAVRALGSRDPGTNARIAALLCRTGREKEGEALFARTLEGQAGRDDERGWRALCRACQSSGSFGWLERASGRAVRSHPDAPELLGFRTVALAWAWRWKEACESARRWTQRAPDSHEAWHQLASALQRVGRDEEGLRAIERACELGGTCVAARLQRGKLLRKAGREQEAHAAFEVALRESDRVLKHLPHRAAVHVNHGLVLASLGRNEDALDAYGRAIALDPGNAPGHYNRGNLLCLMGRQEEAVVALDQALRLYPGLADAHAVRGQALNLLGRHEAALDALERWLELEPDSARAHFERGLALNRLGRHEQALEAYDRSVALDPDYFHAHVNRGVALNRLGRRSEALAAFDRALALDPASDVAHAYRGSVLRVLGRHEDALEALDRALELNADNGMAHACRGDVLLFGWGQREDALAAHERALAAGYRAPPVLNNAAWLHVTLPDPGTRNAERAVALAKEAVASLDHGYHWGTLGVALYYAGRHAEALRALEQAMGRLSGGTASEWFFVAMSKHALGQDDAREWYDRALAWMAENSPHDEELKRFRAEAAEVLGTE